MTACDWLILVILHCRRILKGRLGRTTLVAQYYEALKVGFRFLTIIPHIKDGVRAFRVSVTTYS